MTIAVDLGCKATKQTNKQTKLPVLKTTRILAISKPIMDIFWQNLDENWLDDT